MKVRKAVILASGLNTRMFLISKIIPKAFLPLGVKPAVQILVEECIKEGIREITIVCRKGNKLIENYFSKDLVLEKMLKENKKTGYLNGLKKLEKMCELNFVYQQKLFGEAHAVYCAKKFVSKEPFLVLYGDGFYKAKVSPSNQVLEKFYKKNKHVFGSTGRFVFKQSVFQLLSKINFKETFMANQKGLSLPQVFDQFFGKNDFIKLKVKGKKFDIGNPQGYVKAFKAFN